MQKHDRMGRTNTAGEIKEFFSRWSTAAVLLLLFALAMAGATLVEALVNAEAAAAVVYHSWWFAALLAMLVASFVFVGHRMRLAARKRWDVLLLHWGFVVTLAGAGITHLWGFEGYMHLREGETSNRMMTRQRQSREVPFSVTLDRFTLSRYAGSRSPSSYESDVTIRYRDKVFSQKIFMNNIARVGGYRLYQTSYDGDEKGTILTVGYDPAGTAVSYTGYLLLLAGLIATLLRRGSRLRTLYASLGKNAVAIALVSATLMSAACTDGRTRSERETTAARFGSLAVLSPEGRIEPVDSYASDILRKLRRSDRYDGRTACEVLSGILTDPDRWRREPILRLESQRMAEELGATDRHIALASLFDAEGRYRLGEKIEKIYALSPTARTKADKEYLKLDEKANILYALLEGRMCPLFPADDGRHWLSPGDTARCAPEDSARIAALFAGYKAAVRSGDDRRTDEALDAIADYQHTHARIDGTRIGAEILYNRTGIFRTAFRLYLLCGALLLFVSLRSAARRGGRLSAAAEKILSTGILLVFAAHTAGLGLRWYISGHAPWTDAYESMVYVAWTAVLGGIVFSRRSLPALALSALLGGVALFVSNLSWLDPQITPLVPVLKSRWLMIHVSVVTASYGFFGISAACGLTSLAATIAGRDLREIRIINEMSMIAGLALLTAGIFFGAVWANESWGRYWGWDPKETWALITMVVYAIAVHARFIPRMAGPLTFDTLSVVCFGSVLMTFFGVNHFFSGLHSYGRSEEFSWVVPALGTALTATVVMAARRRSKRNGRTEP